MAVANVEEAVSDVTDSDRMGSTADLQVLARLIAEVEVSARDDDFCAERIGPIEWLLDDISSLYGAEGPSQLADPAEGPAVCTRMIHILRNWDDSDAE